MDAPAKAVKIVEYLQSLDGFVLLDAIEVESTHMGAIIADAILQAGTRYDTVVRPRVRRIREDYPEATTTSAFWQLIEREGVKAILHWRDEEKPNRVVALTQFFLSEGIETDDDLDRWLAEDANRPRLLNIRGVGPKTADYLKILAGMQTVAADRYVFRLLEEAGVAAHNYEEAKEILNLAADAMDVKRALFDQSIWQFMSKRERRPSQA